MPSEFQPQPAVGVMAMRRVTKRSLARAARFSETYVNQVLNGRVRPSPRFRAAAAEFLGIPEGELFNVEDLR